jgi:hypothetical protein
MTDDQKNDSQQQRQQQQQPQRQPADNSGTNLPDPNPQQLDRAQTPGDLKKG